MRLIDYFKRSAQQRQIPVLPSNTPIQIVLIRDSKAALRISQKLFKRGFLLLAIRPPTVPITCLRITLSCMHEAHQIDSLLDNLATYLAS